ncbi:MAG: nucleoside hydrolase [Bryobacteraceae bacterium]|nr:nucleoside hydrolase [Solibacteraceae bacterium]MCO5349475.1 nucleoside hydrolase [Bryobacteraceae bacterium]
MTISRRALLAATASAAAAAQFSPSRLLEIPSNSVHDVVLDTDTYNEIDDQYAVAHAILSPDKMKVHAVYAAPYLNNRSTSAADGMEKSYEEILRILAMLKQPAANFAFRGSPRFLSAPDAPIKSDAALDLIKKALQPRPNPLYVLTVGAPTNVSSAILMEPRIKERIVVVWLGGQPHDWPTAREFNLQQDIHASRVLFDSGVALVQIPTKNVSEHLRTTIPEVERHMKGRSKLGDYLYDQFVDYYKAGSAKRPDLFPWSKVIWDISCVAWLINPAWVPSKLTPSPLLNDDFTYTLRPGRHQIRVATNCNRDAIFFDLFEKLART